MAVDTEDESKQEADAASVLDKEWDFITGVICLAVLQFFFWVHGIILAWHIKRTNIMREDLEPAHEDKKSLVENPMENITGDEDKAEN